MLMGGGHFQHPKGEFGKPKTLKGDIGKPETLNGDGGSRPQTPKR